MDTVVTPEAGALDESLLDRPGSADTSGVIAPTEDADFEWYRARVLFRKWNERLTWAAIAHLGRPQTFVDIGCGDAWKVRTIRMIGARPAVGVESSPAVRRFKPRWAQVYVHKLEEPFWLGRKFDMVMSIGIGEHISDAGNAADIYTDNLVKHTGYWLVFSAESSLIPQEGQSLPVNVQEQAYWRAKIIQKGLIYDQRQSDNLRATWSRIAGPMNSVPRNLQVFRSHAPQAAVIANGASQ